ncbi:MAG: hypothetical protein PHH45_01725, partial [Patescibacteria group bacterium]|nr:hypothetical protein [Patescibacteria group bacterium]
PVIPEVLDAVQERLIVDDVPSVATDATRFVGAEIDVEVVAEVAGALADAGASPAAISAAASPPVDSSETSTSGAGLDSAGGSPS